LRKRLAVGLLLILMMLLTVGSVQTNAVADPASPTTQNLSVKRYLEKASHFNRATATELTQANQKPNYPYEDILGALASVTAAGLIITAIKLRRKSN
jgi:hypothetical protein